MFSIDGVVSTLLAAHGTINSHPYPIVRKIVMLMEPTKGTSAIAEALTSMRQHGSSILVNELRLPLSLKVLKIEMLSRINFFSISNDCSRR